MGDLADDSSIRTLQYHTTPDGTPLYIDMKGESGPILVVFHGGGIVIGSRKDAFMPDCMKNDWPGVLVSADYSLLVPSTGHNILEDLDHLFEFLLTLPLNHHNIVLCGFSGGAYVARQAAVFGARESQKAAPRYTVRGCASYFGMGGDFLSDFWCRPRLTPALSLIPLSERQITLDRWKETTTTWSKRDNAVVASSHDEPLPESTKSRLDIWEYWNASGTIIDSLIGDPYFCATRQMSSLSPSERAGLIPEPAQRLFPQFAIEHSAKYMPPFLLIHGDADTIVPYEESLTTLHALQAGGGKAELITLEGADHGLLLDGKLHPERDAAHASVIEWLIAKGRDPK